MLSAYRCHDGVLGIPRLSVKVVRNDSYSVIIILSYAVELNELHDVGTGSIQNIAEFKFESVCACEHA